MALEQAPGFCNHCQRQTLHQRATAEPNHVAHLLAALFLCGLWLPVWLAIAILQAATNAARPFLCSVCGSPAGSMTAEQAASNAAWRREAERQAAEAKREAEQAAYDARVAAAQAKLAERRKGGSQ